MARVSEPDDVVKVLTKMGDNETLTQIASVGIALGVWFILAGLLVCTVPSPQGLLPPGPVWASTPSW